MTDTKSFADDLAMLSTEVADDIGGIINAVKERKKPKPPPQAATIDPATGEPTPVEKKPESRSRPPKESELPEVLENVTTRLSNTTNAKLTEASLHQRLKKAQPDSRQGIIEAAVRDWLKKNGY